MNKILRPVPILSAMAVMAFVAVLALGGTAIAQSLAAEQILGITTIDAGAPIVDIPIHGRMVSVNPSAGHGVDGDSIIWPRTDPDDPTSPFKVLPDGVISRLMTRDTELAAVYNELQGQIASGSTLPGDEEIGDIAFSNPPGDLTGDEKTAVRRAIQAGTSSFAGFFFELQGVATDAQIPADITRDTELAAAIAAEKAAQTAVTDALRQGEFDLAAKTRDLHASDYPGTWETATDAKIAVTTAVPPQIRAITPAAAAWSTATAEFTQTIPGNLRDTLVYVQIPVGAAETNYRVYRTSTGPNGASSEGFLDSSRWGELDTSITGDYPAGHYVHVFDGSLGSHYTQVVWTVQKHSATVHQTEYKGIFDGTFSDDVEAELKADTFQIFDTFPDAADYEVGKRIFVQGNQYVLSEAPTDEIKFKPEYLEYPGYLYGYTWTGFSLPGFGHVDDIPTAGQSTHNPNYSGSPVLLGLGWEGPQDDVPALVAAERTFYVGVSEAAYRIGYGSGNIALGDAALVARISGQIQGTARSTDSHLYYYANANVHGVNYLFFEEIYEGATCPISELASPKSDGCPIFWMLQDALTRDTEVTVQLWGGEIPSQQDGTGGGPDTTKLITGFDSTGWTLVHDRQVVINERATHAIGPLEDRVEELGEGGTGRIQGRFAALEDKTSHIDFDNTASDWVDAGNTPVGGKYPYGKWAWIYRGSNTDSYLGHDYDGTDDFDKESGSGPSGAGYGLLWVLPNNLNWSHVRLVVRRSDGTVKSSIIGQSLRNVPSTLAVTNLPSGPPDVTVRWSASSDTHPYSTTNFAQGDTVALEILPDVHIPIWEGELGSSIVTGDNLSQGLQDEISAVGSNAIDVTPGTQGHLGGIISLKQPPFLGSFWGRASAAPEDDLTIHAAPLTYREVMVNDNREGLSGYGYDIPSDEAGDVVLLGGGEINLGFSAGTPAGYVSTRPGAVPYTGGQGNIINPDQLIMNGVDWTVANAGSTSRVFAVDFDIDLTGYEREFVEGTNIRFGIDYEYLDSNGNATRTTGQASTNHWFVSPSPSRVHVRVVFNLAQAPSAHDRIDLVVHNFGPYDLRFRSIEARFSLPFVGTGTEPVTFDLGVGSPSADGIRVAPLVFVGQDRRAANHVREQGYTRGSSTTHNGALATTRELTNFGITVANQAAPTKGGTLKLWTQIPGRSDPLLLNAGRIVIGESYQFTSFPDYAVTGQIFWATLEVADDVTSTAQLGRPRLTWDSKFRGNDLRKTVTRGVLHSKTGSLNGGKHTMEFDTQIHPSQWEGLHIEYDIASTTADRSTVMNYYLFVGGTQLKNIANRPATLTATLTAATTGDGDPVVGIVTVENLSGNTIRIRSSHGRKFLNQIAGARLYMGRPTMTLDYTD